MRDPELVSRAQRAAARLEWAWERWRTRHGLGGAFAQPVASYVGYSPEEPRGRPRVVFGVDAVEAEQLAALLDADMGSVPAGQPDTAAAAWGPGGHHLDHAPAAARDAVAAMAPPSVTEPGLVAPAGPAPGGPAAGRSAPAVAGVTVAPAVTAPVVTAPVVTAPVVTVPGGAAASEPGMAAQARRPGASRDASPARGASPSSPASGQAGAEPNQRPVPNAATADPTGCGPGPITPGTPGPITPGTPGPITPGMSGPITPGTPGPIAPSAPGPITPDVSMAAELAGWATGELPGQAAAGLAAWARTELEPRTGNGEVLPLQDVPARQAASPGHEVAGREREERAGPLPRPA